MTAGERVGADPPWILAAPLSSPALSFTVDEAEAGLRLDVLLRRRVGLSSRQVASLARSGRLRVDERALLVGSPRLPAGSQLQILPPESRPALLPERIPLTVLAEDERWLFVDKPAGLPVCPGPGHPAGTLANAVRGLGRPLSALEGELRPGIVHRLDAGTSGVMVVAKHDAAHRELATAFAEHAMERRYLALVEGVPPWQEALCEAAIGRKRLGRKAYGVRSDGRPACTQLKLLAALPGGRSLIQAQPATGRTHQVRVHLASLGLPLCGDTLYGGGGPAARAAARLGLRRPALHAAWLACERLGFAVEAPLPADLQGALASLGWREERGRLG